MPNSKNKIDYRITLTEKQMRVISVALEEYFRIRLGQFFEITNSLVFDDAVLPQQGTPEREKMFNSLIERRDISQRVFDTAFSIARPYPSAPLRDYDCEVAYELYQVIRYALWEDSESKPEWSVDGRPYLPRTDQPKAPVDRVISDGQEKG